MVETVVAGSVNREESIFDCLFRMGAVGGGWDDGADGYPTRDRPGSRYESVNRHGSGGRKD
jgi:hypothetical protein